MSGDLGVLRQVLLPSVLQVSYAVDRYSPHRARTECTFAKSFLAHTYDHIFWELQPNCLFIVVNVSLQRDFVSCPELP